MHGQEQARIRLSVVVITRNQAWNIARLIESVLQHTATLQAREIVVVDSASTDATVAIASAFPIDVIRLSSEQRLTAALGRFVGYQHTSGAYVLFLDGDMELIPGWIERAIDVLEEHPDIAVVAGELHERPLSYRGSGLAHDDPSLNRTSEIYSTLHGGGAALYRRAALAQVGTFDPQLYSDEEPELCLRLRHAGWRVVRMKHAIAYHYSEPRQDIATLLHRRKRNLYLGTGQNIRIHLSDPLLWPYIKERGFGIIPALVLAIVLPIVGSALLKRRWAWLRGMAALGAGMVAADSLRRGSLYASLYGFVQRLIMVDGTLRGMAIAPYRPGEFVPQLEVVRRAEDPTCDLPAEAQSPALPEATAQHTRPRVLVVGPVFRGKQAGGIEMFNQILLTSDLAQRYELLHLDTTRTPMGAGKAGTLALINFYYFFRQLVALSTILVLRRPALMHVPITDRIAFWKEGAFMLLGRLVGVPVLGHVHGSMFKELFKDRPWLIRQAMIRVLRLPNVIIALSEGWRSFMVEHIDPHLPVVIVPNTVDSGIAQLAHRTRQTPPTDGVMVLYMASLHKRKGILEALQAVERVQAVDPSVRFVFAGGIKAESERAEIEQACAALRDNPNVSFPGIVTGDDKIRLFEQASLFILPSYHENFPIAVLEAMAAGLPLVVTPVGALPEVLREGENCLYVQPGDVAGLAERIIRLVTDPQLRAAQGAANVALFRQEYDQPAILAKIEQVYVDLMQYVYRAGG